MKVSTQQFKFKRIVLIAGLMFGMTACNQDDLAPPPPPPFENTAPTILSTAVVTANEGQPYSYRLTATDADADSLSYSVSGAAWLSVDPATGIISGTPEAADVGDNEVTATVSDGTDSVTQSFTITVIAALAENVAPTFTSTTIESGAVDEAYSYTVTANDLNFDDLSLTFTGTLPAWATFTVDDSAAAGTASATLTGTPDIAGEYPIEITLSDGTLDVVQSFTISVSGPAVVTTELVVFENEELPGWELFEDAGAEAEVVTDDAEHDQVAQFTIVDGNTVAGFDSRTAGTPFDASGFVSNGRFSFEMKVVTPPTAGESTPYFLKVEAADGSSTTLPGFVDIRLNSSNEGLSPVTGEWQTYTFDLDFMTSRGLNASEIAIIMIFPQFGQSTGAVYLIDNVKFESVVGGDDGGDDGGNTTDGPELITNGTFDNGLTGWNAVGSVIVEDGDNVLEVPIDTASANVFDINQSFIFDITEGETYVFSFRARASQERTMIAGLGLNGGDFTNISETVSLTTEWQTFTTEVVAVGIGGVGSRVLFDMGVEIGDVYLDDVSVRVKDGAPVVDTGGPELLTNGDFENGLASWKPDVGSVVAEDGNMVFEALIDTATANVFDINQSQIFDITEGETYVFSFRARASEARTIIAGLGLNGGDFTNISQTISLTTEWQTFTTDVVAVGIGGVGSRVLFDMGVDVGNVYLDDVSVKVKVAAVSNELTNGDFENGLASWKPDVGAVVEADGNSYFEAVIESATSNVFDINQSQIFDITEGATYTFSFRARASQERTMVAGLGLNGGDFTNISETVSLTTEWQTFTTDIVAVGIGGVGSRVLFDMGVGVGNVNIDDVSVVLVSNP